MSRDDALAIKAYLFSLPQQHVANKVNNLSFPFNQRWAMAFWNLAFLRDRLFAPDAHDRNHRGNRPRSPLPAIGFVIALSIWRAKEAQQVTT